MTQQQQEAVTIAIANWKGGVGKTQTTLTFGTQLSLLGLRVLVVDCDPQGNSGSGLGYPDFVGPNVYDVLLNKTDIKSCLLPTAIDTETLQYFDPRTHPERPSRPGPTLLPINKEATSADFDLKSRINNWSQQLTKKLRAIRSQFDYILLDCGPSLGTLTTNALFAAQYVVIPTVPERFVLEGLASLIGIIATIKEDNEALQIAGTYFSKVQNWRAHTDVKESLRDPEIRKALMAVFGEGVEPLQVFDTEIKHNAAIATATTESSVIVLSQPESRYTIDYWRLLAEVIAVVGGAASQLLPQVIAEIEEATPVKTEKGAEDRAS